MRCATYHYHPLELILDPELLVFQGMWAIHVTLTFNPTHIKFPASSCIFLFFFEGSPEGERIPT